MTETAPIVNTEPRLPAIRKLVLGKLEVEDYQRSCYLGAQAIVMTRSQALTEAKANYTRTQDEAKRGVEAARAAGEPEQARMWTRRLGTGRSAIGRHEAALQRAQSFLEVIEAGYLPIPRIPALRVELLRETIPPEALEVIASEKEHGLFEYFVVANGEDARADHYRPWHNATSRIANRDPILMGICNGEMFPLAWWR